MERTLIIVKPDAMQRGLAGEIIKRLEQRGLRIIGMKMMQISEDLAKEHYAHIADKPFFPGILSYFTSGPVIVFALEGEMASAIARQTIGATRPFEAEAGTIRGDFSISVGRNLVHGSDSPENGEIEVKRFFLDDEIHSGWKRDTDAWIFE
ncbi:MAG: nucleoside-diphosphate kinase [Chloroflexota bacterium]